MRTAAPSLFKTPLLSGELSPEIILYQVIIYHAKVSKTLLSVKHSLLVRRNVNIRCRSHFTSEVQSVSMSWYRAHSGLVTRCYFLSECCCQKVAVLFLWGALSDDRTDLQFAMQSFNGPSRAEPVTVLYSLIGDSPNLEGQAPVFIPPGTGWPSYTPRHWVPYTSPLTTLRGNPSSNLNFYLYKLGSYLT
jgi:hypothetical protein